MKSTKCSVHFSESGHISADVSTFQNHIWWFQHIWWLQDKDPVYFVSSKTQPINIERVTQSSEGFTYLVPLDRRMSTLKTKTTSSLVRLSACAMSSRLGCGTWQLPVFPVPVARVLRGPFIKTTVLVLALAGVKKVHLWSGRRTWPQSRNSDLVSYHWYDLGLRSFINSLSTTSVHVIREFTSKVHHILTWLSNPNCNISGIQLS